MNLPCSSTIPIASGEFSRTFFQIVSGLCEIPFNDSVFRDVAYGFDSSYDISIIVVQRAGLSPECSVYTSHRYIGLARMISPSLLTKMIFIFDLFVRDKYKVNQ